MGSSLKGDKYCNIYCTCMRSSDRAPRLQLFGSEGLMYIQHFARRYCMIARKFLLPQCVLYGTLGASIWQKFGIIYRPTPYILIGTTRHHFQVPAPAS